LINVILALCIFLIGIYGLLVSKDIIKSLISFNIAQASLIMIYLDFSAIGKNQVPIYTDKIGDMVDPLPQAMMLTNIVIGASITALVLMMSIKIFHHFGTLEWKKIIERNEL
jgi:multicomponent Na+:H+ antiporter subunit C